MGFMKRGKAIAKVLGELGVERSSEQGMFMAKQMIGNMSKGGMPIADVRKLGNDAIQAYKDAEVAFASNAEKVSRYGTFENSLRGEREASVQRVMDTHRDNLNTAKARYKELSDQRGNLAGRENIEAFNAQYGDELTRLQGDIKNNPLTRADSTNRARQVTEAKRAEEQRVALENTNRAVEESKNIDMQELIRRSHAHEKNVAAADKLGNRNIGYGNTTNQKPVKATTGSSTQKKATPVKSNAEQSAQGGAESAAAQDLSYGNYTSDLNRAKLAAGKDFMGRESRNEYFVERMNKRKAEIDAMKAGDERTAAIENFNQDLQSGPGINDYLMGNKIPHKAAGFGIAAVTADVAMGDGRRSNAQLYSSPF